MTDRQAKHVGVEATWRIALKDVCFPVPHGGYNGYNADPFHDLAELFVQVLAEERLKAERRKKLLTLSVVFIAMALGTLLIFWAVYRR